MAKGRKRKSGKSTVAQQKASATGKKPSVETSRENRFTFAEYMVAVCIFWVFLGLQFLVTWVWTRETIGLNYFFLVLGIGFTIVALISWLHDIFFKESESEEVQSSA